MSNDYISRQSAITAIQKKYADTEGGEDKYAVWKNIGLTAAMHIMQDLPSVQPERLTDDDFETIRIHLSAIKEKLCNQCRWEEAEEYQRIIDRFMRFASAQQERKTGHWLGVSADRYTTVASYVYACSECGETHVGKTRYCPHCGVDMKGDQ